MLPLEKDLEWEASSLRDTVGLIIFQIVIWRCPSIRCPYPTRPTLCGSGPIFRRFKLGFGAERYRIRKKEWIQLRREWCRQFGFQEAKRHLHKLLRVFLTDSSFLDDYVN
jgi:hypothetical protein